MIGNRYLLDTNCLIWFQENNPKIPGHVMAKIQDRDNVILFSQISLFEIAIKQKIGKLPSFYVTVQDVYEQGLKDGFTLVNIQNHHIFTYNKVHLIEDHRDPFDRLLIATAIEEKAVIFSADKKFKLYADLVTVSW